MGFWPKPIRINIWPWWSTYAHYLTPMKSVLLDEYNFSWNFSNWLLLTSNNPGCWFLGFLFGLMLIPSNSNWFLGFFFVIFATSFFQEFCIVSIWINVHCNASYMSQISCTPSPSQIMLYSYTNDDHHHHHPESNKIIYCILAFYYECINDWMSKGVKLFL